MDCLIDSAIMLLAKQGQNPKAIRRYLRMKYHITIDLESLKSRLKRLKSRMELEKSLQINH